MNHGTSGQNKIDQAGDSALIEEQEKMDIQATKPGSWKKHMKAERDRYQRPELDERLMYGEWLIDVPEDFARQWRMVPTPKGKRCSIVFGQVNILKCNQLFNALLQNTCQIFNKNGVQIHSIAISVSISPPAICDGLVSGNNVYILDFIEIQPYDIESCDFDCRRYLGTTFLNDNKILKATDKYKKWTFHMLEATPDCSRETIERFASKPETFNQDGLMFYHKEVCYF